MINVGGNSYNNGIKFVGDKYNVSFETKDDVTNIYLRRNSINKTNKFMQILRKIPFIRGFIAVICSNKILLMILIFDILLNSITLPKEEETNVVSIMPIIVIFILMLLVYFLLLVYIFSKVLKKMKCTWQYHGAEHKVIYTNYAEKDITLENCRKSPRVSDNCGTMLVSIMIVLWILLKVILLLANVFMLSAFELIIVMSVAYELFLLERNTPVLSLLFNVGYWLQKHLFTSEPSDAQLAQAIEAFRLLEKAEMNMIPEEELKELLEKGKNISLYNRLT